MTESNAPTSEFRVVWLGFVNASRTLFVPQPDDRPQDQYLPLRDKVIELVTSEGFLKQFEDVWNNTNNKEFLDTSVKEVLLLELKAFAPAVEVVEKTAKPEEKKSWWRSLLGKGSTTVGSIKDLLGSMPPLVKGGLTLLQELFDMFKQ